MRPAFRQGLPLFMDFSNICPVPCLCLFLGLTGKRERGYPVKEKPLCGKRCCGSARHFFEEQPPFQKRPSPEQRSPEKAFLSAKGQRLAMLRGAKGQSQIPAAARGPKGESVWIRRRQASGISATMPAPIFPVIPRGRTSTSTAFSAIALCMCWARAAGGMPDIPGKALRIAAPAAFPIPRAGMTLCSSACRASCR